MVRVGVTKTNDKSPFIVFGWLFVSDRCPVCLSACLSVLSVTLVYCGQMVGWNLACRRPRPWPHCVRWWPSSSLPQKGTDPQLSAYVCCGQLNGWIKMPLCTEIGLGPDTLCYMGPSSPPKKWDKPPIFGPCLLWPNGCLHQVTTWYRPQPRRHCVRRGPTPSRKGHSSHHLFGPCLLWPRSPISATAALL